MLKNCPLCTDRTLKKAAIGIVIFLIGSLAAGALSAYARSPMRQFSKVLNHLVQTASQYGPKSAEAAAALKQVGDSAYPKDLVAIIDPQTLTAIAAWPADQAGKKPEEMTISGVKLPGIDLTPDPRGYSQPVATSERPEAVMHVVPIMAWSPYKQAHPGREDRPDDFWGRQFYRYDGLQSGPGRLQSRFNHVGRNFRQGRRFAAPVPGQNFPGQAAPAPSAPPAPPAPQPLPQPQAYLLTVQPVQSVTAARVLAGIAGAIGALGMLLYWLSLAWWVFDDARKRGSSRAFVWGVLTLLTNLVGLVVYLIVRREERRCPGCGAVVERSFDHCPYCGQKLKEYCGQCQTPLREGWTHCPKCGARKEA